MRFVVNISLRGQPRDQVELRALARAQQLASAHAIRDAALLAGSRQTTSIELEHELQAAQAG